MQSTSFVVGAEDLRNIICGDYMYFCFISRKRVYVITLRVCDIDFS